MAVSVRLVRLRTLVAADVGNRQAAASLRVPGVAECVDDARDIRAARERAGEDRAEKLALGLEARVAFSPTMRPKAAARKWRLELDADLALEAADLAATFRTQERGVAGAVETLVAAAARAARPDLLLLDGIAPTAAAHGCQAKYLVGNVVTS